MCLCRRVTYLHLENQKQHAIVQTVTHDCMVLACSVSSDKKSQFCWQRYIIIIIIILRAAYRKKEASKNQHNSSEERRVGKACYNLCRFRVSPSPILKLPL